MIKLSKWNQLPRNLQKEIENLEGHVGTDLSETYQIDQKLQFLISFDKELINGFMCVKYLENCWDIYNIVIKEEYRRQGIATKFLEELKKYDIILEVDEKNEAVKFYLKSGFKEVTRKKNYYKNGNSALVMYKDGLREEELK